ncbi:MAG: cellulase family glycosylhydrolase [Terracidiphilus sp.]|jgi:endoglucanase
MLFTFIKSHNRAQARERMARSAFLLVALAGALFSSSAWAQGAGYWHTSSNKILDSNGDEVRMAGINWYGFETPDYLVHGLWAQDYHTVLNTIKSLGYNVIRIPFSNQMVESNPIPTNYTTFADGGPVNQALDGQTALTDLDTIVSYAGSIGLRVILDNHRSEAGESNEANGLWYTSAYPQANWIADWQTMATRYSASQFTFNGNPTVIGMDLRNEPHLSGTGATTGSCWTGDTATNGCPTSLTTQNWPVAAETAGNAILAINPKLLIFVEGNDCYSGVCGWQGGNLIGVATNPVTLSVPDQLVYSAHDYGPNLFQQAWFNSNTTPASLDAIWNQYWGYINADNIAPVWLGEFGTDNTSTDIENTAAGSQGQWFESLVGFLQNNPTLNWTYWALNGEDTYDLLDGNYDATPVSALKQSELASIQFPLSETPVPSFTLASSASALSIAQGSSGTATITVTDGGGFTGSVTLAASGLPSGVTAVLGTNPTTGTSALTLTASASAPQGSATITITGSSGALTPVTTTIALTITAKPTSSFTLSASAPSLTVSQGASGAETISVTDVNGFTGSVTFSASGLPSGVTAAFGTNPTTGSSVLTLTASATAASGTSSVTVTGTSGALTPVTITFTLTVTNVEPLALSASAATLSIAPGANATDTITVTEASGTTGGVTLTASGLPSGVTAAFGTNPTTGTSVLTLTASATATAGTSTVTITGTSGTVTATTTIALTVSPSAPTSKCTILYAISPQNTSAFGATITIDNTGTTALTSWTLTWTFANGQTVAELWNGVEIQSGANVTVTNEPYNGSIPAGGSLTGIGFNGTWNGSTNAIPTAFALNGTACTVN